MRGGRKTKMKGKEGWQKIKKRWKKGRMERVVERSTTWNKSDIKGKE